MGWLTATKAAFRSPENLAQVGQESAFIGIMACGQALVILTAGIDLSVGAALALSACAAGSLMTHGWNWALACVAALLVGAVAGWTNGALITFRRLPPILTTLSTLFLYRAIANLATGAIPYNALPEPFKVFGKGFTPFLFLIVAVLVFAVMLARSRFGRRVLATGGSEQAARLSGVPVHSLLRRVYMISGICAAISGLLMSAAANNAQWNLAEGWELEVIAAAVIGGVRLTGGEGSVIGAALGAMIIVVLRNGLFLNDVPKEWYGLITGAVVIVAALTEQLRRRRQEAVA